MKKEEENKAQYIEVLEKVKQNQEEQIQKLNEINLQKDEMIESLRKAIETKNTQITRYENMGCVKIINKLRGKK